MEVDRRDHQRKAYQPKLRIMKHSFKTPSLWMLQRQFRIQRKKSQRVNQSSSRIRIPERMKSLCLAPRSLVKTPKLINLLGTLPAPLQEVLSRLPCKLRQSHKILEDCLILVALLQMRRKVKSKAKEHLISIRHPILTIWSQLSSISLWTRA